jgi:D,D-heptose 1,7-bisphosphate phosphatase
MNFKAVFVDRDGTINIDGPYLSDPEKFQMYPGVGEGAKILKDHGFKIIIITNQSGIGRGYFTENDLVKIHEKMRQVFRKYQVDIDGIYYCPHHPNANCECRKPKTKLFEKAVQEHHIDVKKSYMIGDTIQDIEAGKKIGVKTILIPVINVIDEKIVLKKIEGCKPDYIAINFLKAVDWMLQNDKTN